MSWTGVKGGIEAARLHHDAIMTPIPFLYFSNPTYNRIKGTTSLERVYTFEPVSYTHLHLPANEEGYILSYNGGEIIDWKTGEMMYENVLDPDIYLTCINVPPTTILLSSLTMENMY